MEDHLEASGDKPLHPLTEDDPELEREFQELAQWLLDVYLWRLQEERKARKGGPVDTPPPSPTI
jgi:hypothetical protein